MIPSAYQLTEVKRKCSWTMMNLRTLSRYFDESKNHYIVMQLVISKLEFCNALYSLHEPCKKMIKKLTVTTVFNIAVQFIYNN